MQWTKRLIPVVGASALLATSAATVAAQDTGGAELDLQARVDEFVGLVDGGVAAVTIHDGVVTTAAAGIANAEGDPMTVDTPMLAGGATAPMIYGLALRLVEEGLLDLDAPVVDFLPDAPVGEGATVNDLLSSRHGIPNVWPTFRELIEEDPDRSWTTADMVDLIDRSQITPAGEFTPGYAGTLVTIQLIEAVTGSDLGSALEEYIAGPLELEATVHPGGEVEPPARVAGGWFPLGTSNSVSYVTDDWEAMRSSRPTVSTAADIATFLAAHIDGQIVSPELLDETAWNESVETLGYGFLRQDELFPGAGPVGARYFGIVNAEPSGVNGTLAVAPSTGDVVVVLGNTWALETPDLAQDIVRSWAPDPMASGTLSEAQSTFRYLGVYTCQTGQPTPFDLPPCETDGPLQTMPFEIPVEITGTLDGSGIETGVLILNVEDLTFTYAGRGSMMLDVEDCGSGSLYFTIDDGAGYFGPTGIEYTQGTMEILPGGTLPLAGTFDLVGSQTDHPDGTSTVDFTGSYICQGASA